jgi:predicted RNA binding protein YcfA (HicA-like mRNA interferase family)
MRRLRNEGWKEDMGKGSHVVFRKEGRLHVSVPSSKKELPKGTYDRIAKDAGWK